MNFLLLESVDSTNSYVSLHSSELDNSTMVIADTQTAGRGQRGNSWESEPGKNLTFTMLFRPESMHPLEQFSISEATALAIVDYLRTAGIEAKVKWPNDIYVNDSKIAGILIEHSVTGKSIEHSRIGVGLNVNQREFKSDAPNPVSIYQLITEESDISRTAVAVGSALEQRLLMTSSAEGRKKLHAEFLQSLWRGDNQPHPFRRRSDGHEYAGIITGVSETGPIEILNIETRQTETYAFKEVEFML